MSDSNEINRPRIVQDEYADDIDQRAEKLSGPVYLDQYWTDNSGSIFLVPEQDRQLLPENASGVRVAAANISMAGMLSSAFSSGKQVYVGCGHRWWIGQKEFVWTIFKARVVY